MLIKLIYYNIFINYLKNKLDFLFFFNKIIIYYILKNKYI
jgi:hypothetical protein